jgi:hypothetical protein
VLLVLNRAHVDAEDVSSLLNQLAYRLLQALLLSWVTRFAVCFPIEAQIFVLRNTWSGRLVAC